METRHNINESYESYCYRKRNTTSNSLFACGLIAFIFGAMTFETGLTATSIPLFLCGGLLVFLSIKIRK